MSENKSARDRIARNIDSLFFCGKPGKGTATDYFYEHLTGLLKYYLATAEGDEDSPLKLSKKTYSELEQFALENSGIFEYDEDGERDWDLIDDAKDIFNVRLAEAFGKEIHSDYFSPFVRSVSDSYENWLIYDLMYPGSVFNPWNSLLNLLKTGCIYLISDHKEILTEYVRDIYGKTDKEYFDNIGFIVKSQKEKEFFGFLSDNRHNSQISVYQFLQQYAAGSQNAKYMEIIRDFLSKYEGRHVEKRELRSKVLYPLKDSGLIGSCSKGFFHITASKDLQLVLKVRSSEKVLEIYKSRLQVLQKTEEETYTTRILERITYKDNKDSHPFLYEQEHFNQYSNIPLPLIYSQQKRGEGRV